MARFTARLSRGPLPVQYVAHTCRGRLTGRHVFTISAGTALNAVLDRMSAAALCYKNHSSAVSGRIVQWQLPKDGGVARGRVFRRLHLDGLNARTSVISSTSSVCRNFPT